MATISTLQLKPNSLMLKTIEMKRRYKNNSIVVQVTASTVNLPPMEHITADVQVENRGSGSFQRIGSLNTR